MRNRIISILVLALLLTASHLQAQKGKTGGGGITLYPVTAQFRCPMTAECVADGVEGDSVGVYRGTLPNGGTTTQEGLDGNLGTYLTEDNLFLFVLKSGRGRFVSFSFTQPAGPAPCAGSGTCKRTFTRATIDESVPGSRTYPVDAMGAALPNGFASIAVGASTRAKMFINFADPDGRALLWTVRFNPDAYPGSTFVTVTRLTADSWTIEASATDVAELVSATMSGKPVHVNEGYYRMPFKITVTK